MALIIYVGPTHPPTHPVLHMTYRIFSLFVGGNAIGHGNKYDGAWKLSGRSLGGFCKCLQDSGRCLEKSGRCLEIV